jgi:uridine phosphorylase
MTLPRHAAGLDDPEMDVPLLEGDFTAEGMIEPARVVPEVDMPECAVACFFGEVVNEVVPGRPDARQVTVLSSEAGPSPVWEIELSGRRLAVFQPGVGAPLAAGYLEEVIAMGCRRLVACGGAGALVPELVMGHAVVADSAVRDEGTSYHYLPADRVVDADPHAVATLVEVLDTAGVAHVRGRTWTTDAFYRETRSRVERRLAEGCVLVEMEAAALIAVAKYRGVSFGQVLLAGDSLAGESWEHRGWTSARAARERLFWIAAEAALSL